MTSSSGTLYVVATPIGNLGDITLRARQILMEVDCIAAEDTRTTNALLQHLGLGHRTGLKIFAHHLHNEHESAQGIVQMLLQGQSVALVCDAGTPCISDPGNILVHAAWNAGCAVVPVPGASSVMAALSASGLMLGAFTFLGFLPTKPKARLQCLQVANKAAQATVFFEAPHRVLGLLDELEALLHQQNRNVCAGRELTKQHERFYRGSITTVCAAVRADPFAEKGEWVWVLEASKTQTECTDVDADAATQGIEGTTLDDWLHALMGEMSLKSAVDVVVMVTKKPHRLVYQRALHIKNIKQQSDS